MTLHYLWIAPCLVLEAVMGYNGECTVPTSDAGNLHFVDDHTVAWPAGTVSAVRIRRIASSGAAGASSPHLWDPPPQVQMRMVVWFTTLEDGATLQRSRRIRTTAPTLLL